MASTTIPQMIQSLSKLHQNLSSAIPKPAAATARAATEAETTGSTKAAQLQKLLVSIKHLQGALERTNELDEKLNKPIQSIKASLEEVIKRIKSNPSAENEDLNVKFLDAINTDMKTLKFQIPSFKKLSLAGTTADSVDRGTGTKEQDEFRLPNLYGHKVFDESPAFKDIEVIYNGFDPGFLGLDDVCKKCFLYFAVFPENVVFKKRFLTYWWIGEGLFKDHETPEDCTGEILKKFVEKGLIVPVKDDQKKIKKKFRMPPIVRSAAIKLAKDKDFLDYDSGNNPIAKPSVCDRIFLVKGGGFLELKAPTASTDTTMPTEKADQKLVEEIESIFNVSQPFPDSALEWLAKKGVVDLRTEKAVEWLLKLINLKVLYLGRWQSEVDEQQIEVESYKFLKGLKKMKKLRLLSLQGISWMNKLPNSIKTLSELRVLDLKSCFNLEKLPQGIGFLKNLTHLDVSGCYMLNEMPKSISNLTELTVLKGFISGRSNLNNLRDLKKIRKLSINISRQTFPDDTDLRVLQDLGEHGKLRSLTIMWGAVKVEEPSLDKSNIIRQATKVFGRKVSKQGNQLGGVVLKFLPKELEKLEVQCLPEENLPQWLNPSNLGNLKRLYIRGGKLLELGNAEWNAEVVRLKYMTNLKIEWRELLKSFPKLSYLQKVQCPSVTFCPCDANGVWIKP